MPNKNTNILNAKKQDNNEFYTLFNDVNAECNHYADEFRGKTIYCNCDNPYVSNFVLYFALQFEHLGIKKLIATCYKDSPNTGKAYKIEITNFGDINGDGDIDRDDLMKYLDDHITELEGDGDFRSEECVKLLQEADIVVTNPPFSLFLEYVAQLVKYDKKFLIIGNQNEISCKEIFPLIKENKLWLGYHSNVAMKFNVPDNYYYTETDENGDGLAKVSAITWYTNLPVKSRKEEIILYKNYTPEEYPKYDNYDAINVGKVADIPCDYYGVMGVPITFLTKYNPEQFEIVGISGALANSFRDVNKKMCSGRFYVNGKRLYDRIAIKRKNEK